MPDPVDPPRKKQRAKRQEPAVDPSKPNATIELETADLLQLGQSGLVEPRANKTRDLQLSDLEELREGVPIEDPKIIVDLGPAPNASTKPPSVIVDLGPEAEPVAPVSGRIPTQQPRPARASSPTAAQPSVVVEPSIIVAPQPRPPTPIPAAVLVSPPVRLATPVNVQRVTPMMPKVATPARGTMRIPRQGGMWLVVVVYLLAATALAASIYFRWFA